MLDVYPARERAEDFPGVSGLLVAEADRRRRRRAHGPVAAELRRRRAASCAALLRDGDLCLVLGAGDVDELGRRLAATR